ncbi:MAG: hypothetical protein HY286_10600 [Planctomycetes bacterium]|nr:hypothetical protein [Planctomycetota bacterium]
MTSEADRLRAALSECGLFQQAELESFISDVAVPKSPDAVQDIINNPEPAELASDPAIADGSYMGAASILEALDRVFSHPAPESSGAAQTLQIQESAAAPAAARIARPQPNAERILQIYAKARAESLRTVFFDECDGGFRVSAHLGSRTLDFGIVPKSDFGPLLDRYHTEFVLTHAPTGESITFDRYMTRAGNCLVMHCAPEEGKLSFGELLLNDESRETLQFALDSNKGGLVCVVASRGTGASDVLDLLAGEWASRGKRIVTCGIPGRAEPGQRNIQLNADASQRTLIAQEGDVYFTPPIIDNASARRAVTLALGGWSAATTIPAASLPAALRIMAMYGCGQEGLVAASTVFVRFTALRALCAKCKQSDPDAAATFLQLGRATECSDWVRYFKAVGCESCVEGYKNQILAVDAIRVESPAGFVRTHDILLGHALAAATAGRTSLGEVLRVFDRASSREIPQS